MYLGLKKKNNNNNIFLVLLESFTRHKKLEPYAQIGATLVFFPCFMWYPPPPPPPPPPTPTPPPPPPPHRDAQLKLGL